MIVFNKGASNKPACNNMSDLISRINAVKNPQLRDELILAVDQINKLLELNREFDASHETTKLTFAVDNAERRQVLKTLLGE